MEDSFARALHNRLRNETHPYKRRLKLCTKLSEVKEICQSETINGVLLEWISEFISCSQGEIVSKPNALGLWTMHHNLLKSIVQPDTDLVILRRYLPSRFFKVSANWFYQFPNISEEVQIQIICCSKIAVDSKNLLEALLMNFEDFITFISSVISALALTNKYSRSSDLLTILNLLLEKCHIAQMLQANHEKVFSMCVQQMLKPVAQLLLRQQQTNISDKTFGLLKSALGCFLFSKGLQPHFKRMLHGLLQETFPDNCPEFLINFLRFIQEEFEVQSFNDNMAFCFPAILEQFLMRYKNLESHDKFLMLVLLVRLLGIKLRNAEMDSFNDNKLFTISFSDTEAGLSLLADMLNILAKHPNIYHDVVDNANVKQVEWLQGLMRFLLKETNATKCRSWFRCIQAVLVIDNKMITSNFQLICENAWLSLYQLDSDVQQVQSLFFCQVLTTFAKLHQSSDFINKIIKALSFKTIVSQLKQTHLPDGVLEKFETVCTNLSYGPVLHSWKFLTDYVISYYIPKMAESSDDELRIIKPLVHPVLELMSSLLLGTQFVDHITKVPHVVKEIISQSINTSELCIRPLILQSLKAKDTLLLRNSLKLAHSWGEAHLLLMNYSPVYVQLWKEKNHCISPTGSFSDLTTLHFYIGAKDWHLIYKECAGADEPALHFMFAKLVAQKIRALLSIKKEPSEMVKNGIKSAAGYLVALVNTCDHTAVWDKKISSINEANFPVAVWALICESLPILVSNLSLNDIMKVTRMLVTTYKEEPSIVYNQSSVTRSLTSLQQFKELIWIQSAIPVVLFEELGTIIDSKERKMKHGKLLWEKISEILHTLSSNPELWLQYEHSTPIHCADGLNPLWSMITDVARVLSNAFCTSVNQEDLTFLKKQMPLNLLLDRLMFLGQLPLEYFVPSNQIHCLFGIFALLIPIVQCTDCDSILLVCVNQCLKTVFALVDSMRSNWLLDFIPAKDLLLWIFGPFITFQTRLSTNNFIDTKLLSEFQETSNQFLEVMLNLVKGNRTAFTEFDKFLSQVELLPAWQQVANNSGNETTISYAVIMMQLFHKMQQTSNTTLLTTCHNYISRISKSLIKWFLAIIKTERENDISQEMIHPFLTGFNIILQIQMDTDKQVLKEHAHNFKHWKKLIPMVKQVLSNSSSLSQDFVCAESICQIMGNFCKHRDSLSKYIPKDIFQEAWKVMAFYLQSTLLLNQGTPTQLSEYPDKISRGTGFVEQLISSSSNNDFDWLLKTILNDFNPQEIEHSNVDRLKFVLHVWFMLSSTSLNCDRKIILEKHSPKFMLLCQYTLYQIAQQVEPPWEIAARVIEVEATLIRNSKMTAGRVTLCLQGCEFLDMLEIHNYEFYGRCFEAVSLLLNNILISKTNILEKMMPPFLAAVHDMMRSVIQKGQQQLMRDAPEDVVMLMCGCAHKLERLLAQITVTPLDFTKVAPYIIAYFVTESCSVTLYPAVKGYLTEGIYAVMQLCDHHAVAALQASLNDTARQVFNSIYETYNHYYQYKGKV